MHEAHVELCPTSLVGSEATVAAAATSVVDVMEELDSEAVRFAMRTCNSGGVGVEVLAGEELVVEANAIELDLVPASMMVGVDVVEEPGSVLGGTELVALDDVGSGTA
jgi:hypothetical protein